MNLCKKKRKEKLSKWNYNFDGWKNEGIEKERKKEHRSQISLTKNLFLSFFLPSGNIAR